MASFKNLISNTSAQISSGGTITGDLVINGDLQVDGGGSLSFDEIIEGTSQVKVTNTSAFLVEKSDGTDVFIVDTTNSRVGIGVTPTSVLHINTPTDGNTIQFDRSGQETYKLFHGTSGLFLSKPDSTDVAVALVTQDGDFYTKDASDNFLLFSDTSTSRVGIGNSSPESLLHIESTQNATMRIHNTTT